MLTKKFLNQQSSKINKHLNFIFHNSILSEKAISSKEFQKIIENEINILFGIEKQLKSSSKTPNSILISYNKLTKNKFKPNDVKFENEYDYTDQLNWLLLYCKNNFNIDINGTNQNQNLELNKQQSVIESASDKNITPIKILSPNLQSLQKFSEDVKNGKIFIYKTKPRIIKILKIIFMYTFLLFTIFSTFVGVMFLATSTPEFINVNNSAFGWPEGIFWLLFSGFAWRINISNFNNWYKKNNDNYKYFFAWHYVMLFFLCAGLFWLTDIFGVKDVPTIFHAWINVINGNFPAYITIETWILFLCYCIMTFFFIVSIIIMIIASKKNPKRDDQIISKYLGDDKPISK